MITTIKRDTSQEKGRVKNKQGNVFLERIPAHVYRELIDLFSKQYHFQNGLENGGRMRIANYFVGISRSLSNSFVEFIETMCQGLREDKFPQMPTPKGFTSHPQNMLPTEWGTGFSLGSFDMAVTESGLQNIEFQAVPTYPISAARLNQCLANHLKREEVSTFADSPYTNWEDLRNLYTKIIAGTETHGVVLVDRKLAGQKTSFEFYATQEALKVPLDIVDMEHIFEEKGELFYTKAPYHDTPIKITRFYNRILLAEALFEEDYPDDTHTWKFRFDKPYQSLSVPKIG